MNWSIGVSTGSCSDLPVLAVAEVLQAAGVRGVEIGTLPRHFDQRHEPTRAATAERLAALGIAAVSIHAPFGHDLDLAHVDHHRRDAGLDGIVQAARAIRQLGGTIVVAHPSDLPRTGADIVARLETCAAGLRLAAAACRHEGVRLAIESPLPHLIGGHPDEFAWILDHVGEAAGACLDTGHIALGRAWPRFVDITAGRLLHVHASDNHGQYDDHLPPGDGTIDWAEVMGSLRAAAFDGWMMLELRCPGEDGPGYFRRAVHQASMLAACPAAPPGC